MEARSRSPWNDASPAGAIVSAYSTTTPTFRDVTRSRSSPASAFSRGASRISSACASASFAFFTKRTPVARL